MPRRNRPIRPRRPPRLKLPQTHGTYHLPASTEPTGSENTTKENQR